MRKVEITGLWLFREMWKHGGRTTVRLEVKGEWLDALTVGRSGPVCHIMEGNAIANSPKWAREPMIEQLGDCTFGVEP